MIELEPTTILLERVVNLKSSTKFLFDQLKLHKDDTTNEAGINYTKNKIVELIHETNKLDDIIKFRFSIISLKNRDIDIWYMSPKKSNIRLVKHRFNVNSKFPNGNKFVEISKDVHNSESFIILFDANPGGMYNPSAKWIARLLNVEPTGNFIIMRKVYFDNASFAVDMTTTPKKFIKLIKLIFEHHNFRGYK